MRGSRKRAPRPRLIDRLLRLFHRTPFSGRYTITIPAGVELRMSRRYLEAHRRIFGGTPPAGTTSRTILLHPMTLDWSAAAVDGLLAHELTHVAQFDRWGFFGTYARYFWGLWKHGYGDHPLEHEARSEANTHREEDEDEQHGSGEGDQEAQDAVGPDQAQEPDNPETQHRGDDAGDQDDDRARVRVA